MASAWDGPLPAVDWSAVARWAAQRTGQAVGIQVMGRARLAGGEVSDSVQRLELAVHVSDGAILSESLVLKRTWAWELVALRALAGIPGVTAAVPVLIDGGVDDEGAWALLPFYPGSPPAEHHDPPSSVLDALARVHAHFSDRGKLDGLAGLDEMDAAAWHTLCHAWTLPGIEMAQRRRPRAVLDRADRLVRGWSTDHRMADALAVLPPVLVHGDVHAGNVLISQDTAVLIDWGNARIGPAMLDVANCAPPGSANYDTYLRAWAEITGEPLNPTTAAIGAAWAAVHVNVQYLGWAAQHLDSSRVETMLDHAEAALNDLEDALHT